MEIVVPEYEIVPIRHVRKRSIPDDTENIIEVEEVIKKPRRPYENRILEVSENNLRLKAFGKPFNLSLVPTEGLLKKGQVKNMDY
ncbi:hypothetical protein NQ314_018498 [Rhamnusium bicolor]|uniref:Uncharacterized protein n=1 Tax=Rhamnusium bicolor TaxID=1586634 RepID=A0AAV8WQJ7_9CUCU|nr:hypothetical protein NQ314_018498 [Rhamnusium bicolor]